MNGPTKTGPQRQPESRPLPHQATPASRAAPPPFSRRDGVAQAIPRLNRKSVLSWAGGSTRRSAAGPGSFGVVPVGGVASGVSGRLLEGDFHPGQAFQLGDELAFAPEGG